MSELLHIATFNIHKGFSRFNRRMTVHDLREKLGSLGAHVVFLQEVQGSHDRRAARDPAATAVRREEGGLFMVRGAWPSTAGPIGFSELWEH